MGWGIHAESGLQRGIRISFERRRPALLARTAQGIGFVSSLLTPQPPAIGEEWFAAQLIR
jgi:hypothetical protein